MASKNNAVENFEEWRKNKPSADAPATQGAEEEVTPPAGYTKLCIEHPTEPSCPQKTN